MAGGSHDAISDGQGNDMLASGQGDDALIGDDVANETNPDRGGVLLTLFDGREHWKHLRTAGHDLIYWHQTESGGWEQKG